MPETHNFEHLPLFLRQEGRAKLFGGGKTSPQTVANRNLRVAHSASLLAASGAMSKSFLGRRADRDSLDLPTIESGIPILLKIDPGLDLDQLRARFAFEIVAEQEEGYVLVASEDIDLTEFVKMVEGFSVKVRGSATIASVHKLFDDPEQIERLRHILSDLLFEQWPQISDDQVYVVDIGISCAGTSEIPALPTRGKRDTDADWARKELAWSQARTDAYDSWDDIKRTRETDIESFADSYGADILHLIDNGAFNAAVLPDSFTVRMRILGKGLKDLVLTYAYGFEVVEPEDISLPQRPFQNEVDDHKTISPIAPDLDAPAVCVIDSGIQEGHIFIRPAIAADESYCFLPKSNPQEVGDFVKPGGARYTRFWSCALRRDYSSRWKPKASFLDSECSCARRQQQHAG